MTLLGFSVAVELHGACHECGADDTHNRVVVHEPGANPLASLRALLRCALGINDEDHVHCGECLAHAANEYAPYA